MAVDHSPLLEHIAGELDRLMCARSLTQKALYESAACSEGTISRLLRARDARLTTLVRVADALGVEVQVTFRVKR